MSDLTPFKEQKIFRRDKRADTRTAVMDLVDCYLSTKKVAKRHHQTFLDMKTNHHFLGKAAIGIMTEDYDPVRYIPYSEVLSRCKTPTELLNYKHELESPGEGVFLLMNIFAPHVGTSYETVEKLPPEAGGVKLLL